MRRMGELAKRIEPAKNQHDSKNRARDGGLPLAVVRLWPTAPAFHLITQAAIHYSQPLTTE